MGSIWPIVHKDVIHSWFCGLYLVAYAVYLRHWFPHYLSCCCLVYLSWILVPVLANWFLFIMDVKDPPLWPFVRLLWEKKKSAQVLWTSFQLSHLFACFWYWVTQLPIFFRYILLWGKFLKYFLLLSCFLFTLLSMSSLCRNYELDNAYLNCWHLLTSFLVSDSA